VGEIADEIRLNESLNSVRYWVVLDEWVDLRDVKTVVWLTGSNVEVLRDIKVFPTVKGRVAGIMVIDATVKTPSIDGFHRPWPNPTIMDRETIELVDRKWQDYDLGSLIPSPSNKYLKYYRDGAVRTSE
jgi:4-hydroxy-3-polyprenylbenzoate decarboxylase